MKKESTDKKETVKTTKSAACKKCKSSGNQRHEEIISEEEFFIKGGITGGKTEYFTLYLHMFYKGNILHKQPKTIRNLAKYIYNRKELYTHKSNGYKLLEISSIITGLSALSKSVKEEIEREKKKTKKKQKETK